MTERMIERLGALAGLVASLSVGIPVALDGLRGAGDLLVGPPWVWWACYGGYLAAFVAIDRVPSGGRWLTEGRLLAVQAVLGAVAVTLAHPLGWMPVLLVVTAVTAAYVLPPRATVALAAAQTVLLAVLAMVSGAGATEAVLAVLVYGSLQAFAILMVLSSRREALARARLADAHAELRAATALLADASRTAERLRIARDLHDVVGHQLTALALELEVASHRAEPPVSEHVTRARRIAKDLLADVRAAVGDLRARPAPLRSALASLIADLPRPRVHLDVADDVELDGDRTTALVRCVQEIVTNTVRHADADNLWIRIDRTAAGRTRLLASDDGRGAGHLELGHGLTGLCERVEQLGGAVSFEHRGGFRVVAEVPAS